MEVAGGEAEYLAELDVDYDHDKSGEEVIFLKM